MGCYNSKNKVGPAPQEEDEEMRHFSLGKRKQRSSARIRSPVVPVAKRALRIEVAPALNSTPSPTPSTEDGRRSVAFTVPLVENRTDGLVPIRPPRRLQPLSHPQMSAEILIRKQKLADAKREEALRKKREIAHKAVKRGEEVLKSKETERAQSITLTGQQIIAQQKTAESLRQARQQEIVEKQRKREERAQQVRKQKTEPLNDNRLTAFVSFDDSKTEQNTVNTTQQKQLSLLEKMTKRAEEVEREAEKRKALTNQRIEAQLKTALEFSMGRLKEAQQQADQRSEHQVLKTTEAKIDLTEPGAPAAAVNTQPPKEEENQVDDRPLRPASTTQRLPFYRANSPKGATSEEKLHNKLAENQLKAVINRQARQRDVIMRQKWRELKAKEIRRKAQELREEEAEIFDFGEIEADETYGRKNDVDFWDIPYTDRLGQKPPSEPDDFFDG